MQSQYLPGTFQAAGELYNTGQLSQPYYPGQTVADFDPVRAQGLNTQLGTLPVQGQLSDALTGGLLGIATGSDPATQRLAQQAAGAQAAQFSQAGTLGSARQQLASNKAASDAILGRQFDAFDRIPDAQKAALVPGQILSGAGRTLQDYEQSVLDADRARLRLQRTATIIIIEDISGSPWIPKCSHTIYYYNHTFRILTRHPTRFIGAWIKSYWRYW